MPKLVTIDGYGRCKVCHYVFNIMHFAKFGHAQERERVERGLSPCCGAVTLPYRRKEDPNHGQAS